MGFVYKLLSPILLRLMRAAVKGMSPQIREEAVDLVNAVAAHCDKTMNKVDDIVADLLRAVFDIK